MRNLPTMLTKEENEASYWIQAFKEDRVEGGWLVACEIDDPNACKWTVKYPGMWDAHDVLECHDRRLAEQVLRMTLRSFDAGGQRKLLELRRFLGVKDH